MNENLSNILRGVGISERDFHTQQSFLSSSPTITLSETMEATANPTDIEDSLQGDDTLYASITESVDPVEQSPSNDFSDNDFEDILSDVGMNDNEPIQEVVEPVAISDFPQVTVVDTVEREQEAEEEERNGENVSIPPIPPTEPTSPVPSNDESHPHIRENSPTLLVEDATSRFSGTTWYENVKKANIMIAGIGGIGSNLAYQIARLHPNSLYLYDADIIEEGNLSGQLFSRNHLGWAKVDAMSSIIRDFTSTNNVIGIREMFTPNTPATDIMMCGFDSMGARKTYYNAWKNHVSGKTPDQAKQCLFLDGRLSIDTLQVFAITGDDHYSMSQYEQKYLFHDYEAEETVCSMKQTTYLACMIGSVMTNLFINFIANFTEDGMYELPFFTQYDARNMLFKSIQ